MSQPDFKRARQYALRRLKRELSPNLFYHSLAHTRDDVVPAIERLAALEGVNGEALLLLRTAALFHDIGFVERYTDNEIISIRIASEVLPDFGYTPAHLHVISGIILATTLPQTPHNLLEEIMADADLDVLGREDFFVKNEALRRELAIFGMPTSDEAWYSSQLKFLESHRYFTTAAKTLREAKKQQHIQELSRRLEACRA
ncbi:MAG: hypothetical protein KatS3mg057_2683 [Herpetosiphonaceae bacterium]|nr:MAG: hypothetical protein KatS3mg057_2683 [Herpetosiphonaceae bacterium]